MPSLACKNKTEKDCNCSRIAKETAMMSVIFVEGRRQLIFAIGDKNKKDPKEL